MRNAINYYYNLYPKDIHQTNKYFKFILNNSTYIMAIYNRNNEEITALINLTKMLASYGIYIHQIIPNNTNEYITIINNIPYVLLKVYVDLEKNITLTDIIHFNSISIPIMDNQALRRDDWWQLWTNKIDYFEYQVNQFGIKYPLIRESFSYFVGLAETSITLFKNTQSINTLNLTLSHKRIKASYTQDDLYNPLNLVLDYRMRDVCEYFKDAFFNDKIVEEEIYDYLNNIQFNKNEAVFFLARMIYPSFYFDIYENIISDKIEEKALEQIIFKVTSYEKFLKRLYLNIRRYYDIPSIEWLNQ